MRKSFYSIAVLLLVGVSSCTKSSKSTSNNNGNTHTKLPATVKYYVQSFHPNDSVILGGNFICMDTVCLHYTINKTVEVYDTVYPTNWSKTVTITDTTLASIRMDATKNGGPAGYQVGIIINGDTATIQGAGAIYLPYASYLVD